MRAKSFHSREHNVRKKNEHSSPKVTTLTVRFIPQAKDHGVSLLPILMKKGSHPIYNQLALSHLEKQ